MSEQTSSMNGKHLLSGTYGTGSGGGDFTQLDDSALLSMRAAMRAELERLPPTSPGYAALAARYDETTEEVDDRTRRAWTRNR